MRIRVLVTGLMQAGLIACGQAVPPRDEYKQDSLQAHDAAPAGAPSRSVPETAAASPAELQFGARPVDPASGMIIRSGTASIEVDSLDPGLAAVRALALRLGGHVANTTIQSGREQLRSATLEVKVPARRFDDLTAGLDPLGKVRFVNVAAQDVGEEFVDLSARAANARRLEQRLIDLLGTRTGKLADVLSVERELARVREEVERMEGRMRYVESRAAVSSLAITLHEPPPLVGTQPGRGVLAEAFRRAWRNFVEVLAGAIASLGYLIPAATLVWGAILLGRRWRRQVA